MNELKTLREVCRELNVPRRAIQGYEKEGLVAAAAKNKYGHLLYDEAAVERIRKIRVLWQIGFPVKEIREIIDAPKEIFDKSVADKIAETEAWIRHKEAALSEARGWIKKI